MGKLVTHSIAKIAEAANGNLATKREDTLRTMIEDCDEHSCFSKSNAEAMMIGKLQAALENELSRRFASGKKRDESEAEQCIAQIASLLSEDEVLSSVKANLALIVVDYCVSDLVIQTISADRIEMKFDFDFDDGERIYQGNVSDFRFYVNQREDGLKLLACAFCGITVLGGTMNFQEPDPVKAAKQ